jgi:SAM-dependent methyltransferase
MSSYQHLELDNHGERLVPGISHDAAEYIRHQSTYQLFEEVIANDIRNNPGWLAQGITVLDLGCGTGHGTFRLANILGVNVVGTDISEDAIEFARANYAKANIEYKVQSLDETMDARERWDYIVSRHALEHVPQGVDGVLKLHCHHRAILSVPYMEEEGNPHHLHFRINETSFQSFARTEFAYEDLQGVNHADPSPTTNSITCIATNSSLPPALDGLSLPASCYDLKGLELSFFELKKELEHQQSLFGSPIAQILGRIGQILYNGFRLVHRQLRKAGPV